MDGNYSAPASPTAAMNEALIEGTNSRILGDRDADADMDAQQDLTEAAAAVNESLHRLAELRRSISELTHGSASHNSRTHVPNSSVGPLHTAIVLSDAIADGSNPPDVVPEMPRLRSTVSADIMERLVEFEASIRPRLNTMGRSVSGNPHNSMTQQPSADSARSAPLSTQTYLPRTRPITLPPSYQDPPVPFSARTWLESSLSHRRETDFDDSSTVLGRRVAASGTSLSEISPSQLEQIILTRTTAIARDLQAMTDLLASRGVELWGQSQTRPRVNEPPQSTSSNPHPNDIGNGGVLHTNDGRASSRMASFFPYRPPNYRLRFGRATGAMESQSSEDQEEGVYTPPVPHIPTTFDSQPRRIIHDERNRPGRPRDGTDGRRYLVRRRRDIDGQESESESDAMEWLMPPSENLGPPEIRNRRTSLRDISPPTPPTRPYVGLRSRASGSQTVTDQPVPTLTSRWAVWARLDADGNEITADEDELERTRAQSRVRTQAQVRSFTSSSPTLSPVELGTAARESLIPMTRTSITHSPDDVEVMARVHINPPRQPDLFSSAIPANGDALQTSMSAQSYLQSRPTFGSYRSFQPEPLPMPLADMIPPPKLHIPNPRIVSVHKYANLAGR